MARSNWADLYQLYADEDQYLVPKLLGLFGNIGTEAGAGIAGLGALASGGGLDEAGRVYTEASEQSPFSYRPGDQTGITALINRYTANENAIQEERPEDRVFGRMEAGAAFAGNMATEAGAGIAGIMATGLLTPDNFDKRAEVARTVEEARANSPFAFHPEGPVANKTLENVALPFQAALEPLARGADDMVTRPALTPSQVDAEALSRTIMHTLPEALLFGVRGGQGARPFERPRSFEQTLFDPVEAQLRAQRAEQFGAGIAENLKGGGPPIGSPGSQTRGRGALEPDAVPPGGSTGAKAYTASGPFARQRGAVTLYGTNPMSRVYQSPTKSAIEGVTEPGRLPVWYSPLIRTIETKVQPGTKVKVLQQLIAKGGPNMQDEARVTGALDFLNELDPNDKVDTDALLAHVRARQFDISETRFASADLPVEEASRNALDSIANEAERATSASHGGMTPEGQMAVDYMNRLRTNHPVTMTEGRDLLNANPGSSLARQIVWHLEAEEALNAAVYPRTSPAPVITPPYSSYTLTNDSAGGTYRQSLLSIPSVNPARGAGIIEAAQRGLGPALSPEREQMLKKWEIGKLGGFQSEGHFPEHIGKATDVGWSRLQDVRVRYTDENGVERIETMPMVGEDQADYGQTMESALAGERGAKQRGELTADYVGQPLPRGQDLQWTANDAPPEELVAARLDDPLYATLQLTDPKTKAQVRISASDALARYYPQGATMAVIQRQFDSGIPHAQVYTPADLAEISSAIAHDLRDMPPEIKEQIFAASLYNGVGNVSMNWPLTEEGGTNMGAPKMMFRERQTGEAGRGAYLIPDIPRFAKPENRARLIAQRNISEFAHQGREHIAFPTAESIASAENWSRHTPLIRLDEVGIGVDTNHQKAYYAKKADGTLVRLSDEQAERLPGPIKREMLERFSELEQAGLLPDVPNDPVTPTSDQITHEVANRLARADMRDADGTPDLVNQFLANVDMDPFFDPTDYWAQEGVSLPGGKLYDTVREAHDDFSTEKYSEMLNEPWQDHLTLDDRIYGDYADAIADTFKERVKSQLESGEYKSVNDAKHLFRRIANGRYDLLGDDFRRNPHTGETYDWAQITEGGDDLPTRTREAAWQASFIKIDEIMGAKARAHADDKVTKLKPTVNIRHYHQGVVKRNVRARAGETTEDVLNRVRDTLRKKRNRQLHDEFRASGRIGRPANNDVMGDEFVNWLRTSADPADFPEVQLPKEFSKEPVLVPFNRAADAYVPPSGQPRPLKGGGTDYPRGYFMFDTPSPPPYAGAPNKYEYDFMNPYLAQLRSILGQDRELIRGIEESSGQPVQFVKFRREEREERKRRGPWPLYPH